MITTLVLENGTVYKVGAKGVTAIAQNGSIYIVSYGNVGDQIIIDDDIASAT